MRSRASRKCWTKPRNAYCRQMQQDFIFVWKSCPVTKLAPRVYLEAYGLELTMLLVLPDDLSHPNPVRQPQGNGKGVFNLCSSSKIYSLCLLVVEFRDTLWSSVCSFYRSKTTSGSKWNVVFCNCHLAFCKIRILLLSCATTKLCVYYSTVLSLFLPYQN